MDHQLEQLSQVGVTELVVVLGYYQDEYETLLSVLGEKYPRLKIRTVINESPERGVFSSIQSGLLFIESSAVFVLPIDVPVASRNTWIEMHETLSHSVSVVVPRYQDKGGHPILLGSAFVQKMCGLDARTARLDEQVRLLPQAEYRALSVEDPNITLNLNTPEAFKSFETRVNLPSEGA